MNACAQTPRHGDPGQYISALNTQLDGVLRSVERRSRQPLVFSANLFFAHGAAIKSVPLDTLIRYADGLKEAGAQRIDINPGPFPWLNQDAETIAKHDSLIRHIRRLGLQLAFNPEYNRGSIKIKRFSDWETAALKFYAELARRYQPDIFVLAHEPTTMADRMGIRTTPRQWRDFVVKTAAVVKRASPKTRLGAGGLAKEIEYFREFASLTELDVLTLDIFNPEQLARYDEMIRLAKRAGKAVYIEETWRPPYFAPRGWRRETLDTYMATGIGDAAFQKLDAKWLAAMAHYASARQLEAVTPFWTQTFFVYDPDGRGGLDPRFNVKVINALKSGGRTDTFRAYQRLSQQLGRQPGSLRRR